MFIGKIGYFINRHTEYPGCNPGVFDEITLIGTCVILPKIIKYTIKQNILNSLRIKLAYLSSVLNDNLDLVKTQQILNNIELCVKNIKLINESM